MIKLYGHPQTSAGRCYWALHEIDLPYESISVDMKMREHKTPEYLTKNPNGKVPCLMDGDLVLWESMAINHYLAEQYQPKLLGVGVQSKAKVVQWSYWSMAEYQRPMIDLFIQLVFVPEGKRDESVIRKSIDRILPLNRILDQHLLKKEFMVGESFSLADLHVASVAKLNRSVNIDTSEHQNLNRWLNQMLERPAHLQVEKLAHPS